MDKDEEETIAYSIPGEILEPTKTSTPVVKREKIDTLTDERRFLLDFDDLSPLKTDGRAMSNELTALKQNLKQNFREMFDEMMTQKRRRNRMTAKRRTIGQRR